ncbi:energy transducer TonB [Ilyomonas limi]|nr:energy transducer TonB [Ilyomonas limi]
MRLKMKMGILIALCVLFSNITHAQTLTNTIALQSDTIEVEAKFPGGAAGWASYLQHNLRAEVGAENLKVKRHHTVRQTVLVSFLVNKEGKISEVTVVNPKEVHPALAAEAMRVIKEGPDWSPATINSVPVIYRQMQSITFEVSAE